MSDDVRDESGVGEFGADESVSLAGASDSKQEPRLESDSTYAPDSENTNDSDSAADSLGAPSVELELELLKDLQRLQAEFVNYKTRVERDRDVARNSAIAEVLRAILPALDDLSRAEAHGDLEGTPFAAVVTKLRNAGDKFGLVQFGAKGDKFDPELHNALVQNPSSEVTENVIADVVEPGYMIGDRLLRPAMVAVNIPA